MQTIKTLSTLILVLGMAACSSKSENSPASAKQAPAAQAARLADASGGADKSASSPINPATRRYLALSHHLTVETAEDNVQKAFDATLNRCEKLGCDILIANINRNEGRYQPPSGKLSLRVPPGLLDAFLAGLAKDVNVVRHERESVDKTDAVIDAEARIKNLSELRDRLRGMLANRTGNLKEVLEVERELANTQSQLDTVVGVRKALASQTDLVAVQIDFRTASSPGERSFFAPVISSWNEAGNVFMYSFGGLITVAAGVLPWLLVLIPCFMLLKRAWRRRRERK